MCKPNEGLSPRGQETAELLARGMLVRAEQLASEIVAAAGVVAAVAMKETVEEGHAKSCEDPGWRERKERAETFSDLLAACKAARERLRSEGIHGNVPICGLLEHAITKADGTTFGTDGTAFPPPPIPGS